MDHDFHRVRRLPPYVVAEVNSMKAAARAAGEDVLDFGMGNPDLPSPSHVVEKLVEVVQTQGRTVILYQGVSPGYAVQIPSITVGGSTWI